MKLPVKPKGDRDIIDDDNAFVCFANTTKDRDQIIKAINSHEKLVDVCRNALTSLAITKLPRLDDGVASDNDIIEIVISSLQQALEAEKT